RPVLRGPAETGVDLQHAADVHSGRLRQREERAGHVLSRARWRHLQGHGFLQAVLLRVGEGGAVHPGLHPVHTASLRGLSGGGYCGGQGGPRHAQPPLGQAEKVVPQAKLPQRGGPDGGEAGPDADDPGQQDESRGAGRLHARRG
ncbi:unnamed protein product, partial [Ectocarpus fasciculatus]